MKDEDIAALDKYVTHEAGSTVKIRKELWFGLDPDGHHHRRQPVDAAVGRRWTNGHLGLLMLALVVVAIMLGFPPRSR